MMFKHTKTETRTTINGKNVHELGSNTYTVDFELYGKKLRLTNLVAKNKNEVKQIIKNKIVFHSIKNNNQYSEMADNINWDEIKWETYLNVYLKYEKEKEKQTSNLVGNNRKIFIFKNI